MSATAAGSACGSTAGWTWTSWRGSSRTPTRRWRPRSFWRPLRPLRPRADPADPLHRRPHDVARWGIGHRRKRHVGPEIAVRQLLQELRGSALGDARPAVHDQVLHQARRLELRPLDRDRDSGVPAHVLQLLLACEEMPGHDLAAVETDPDARDLR